MLNLSRKNNSSLYFSLLLTLLFFLDLCMAQEKIITLNFTKNSINSNYWWLEKNNFGRDVSKFDFQGNFELEKSKTKYMINIFSKSENNNIKNIYLNESFIKYNFSNNTFIRIGRYYRDFSLYLNDDLSSGSMLISNNAQAMPKVGLVTSKKIKKNKKISFDFGVAHGFFDKNNIYSERPLLHEKFIYINFGRNDYKFSIGLVHEAIWGGTTYEFGKQPSNFSDFLRVFISADRKIEDYNLYPTSHANALGNHLGIWDFNIKKISNDKVLSFYYQHFFEDTSGLRFANQIDGLWGLELKNYIPNNIILLEYLHTTNQNKNPPYLNDSYYNHGRYKSGWSYKGNTIGNPFISSGYQNVNPVNVFHFGFSGLSTDKYSYKVLISRKTNVNDSLRYLLIFGSRVGEKFVIESILGNSKKNENALLLKLKYNF